MKKITLASLFILITFQAQAQQGFIVGIQAGPQNTWISNRNDKDAEVDAFKYVVTWGYAGMFKLGYNFGPPLGIHTGITYSDQGQKNTFRDTLGTLHTAKRSLTYIKIPLLVHISTDPNAPATVVFEFGPQMAILNEAVHYVDKQVQAPGIDPNLLYEKTEFEIAWAIGTDIRMGDNICFSLMHRGDYGIFDMEDKTVQIAPGIDYYPAERLKANNLTLAFMGGFTVNFSIKAINKYDKRLYWRGGHGR